MGLAVNVMVHCMIVSIMETMLLSLMVCNLRFALKRPVDMGYPSECVYALGETLLQCAELT